MKTEHFDPDHIHTTPDGRHFRHGDGQEMDAELPEGDRQGLGGPITSFDRPRLNIKPV